MRKNLLYLLFVLVFSSGLAGQNEVVEVHKFSSLFKRVSLSATMSTPAIGINEFGQLNFRKLGQISLSDLNLSYKLSPRVSIGLSTMNNLSNGIGGYYNKEGQFFSLCDDDELDEDEIPDDPKDSDDIEYENDDDCHDDEFGQNLMGTFTFKISEESPFFLQVAGGYAFASRSPAYTALIGYNQKIFSGISIRGGVRFSDIMYKKPADAVKTTSTAGLKVELGLGWNF